VERKREREKVGEEVKKEGKENSKTPKVPERKGKSESRSLRKKAKRDALWLYLFLSGEQGKKRKKKTEDRKIEKANERTIWACQVYSSGSRPSSQVPSFTSPLEK